MEPSRTVLPCNLFASDPNFFLSVLQASHSVVFLYFQNTIKFVSEKLKMFSLYIYQLNKSSSDLKLEFLVFIAFLESVPTFMVMGFVDSFMFMLNHIVL